MTIIILLLLLIIIIINIIIIIIIYIYKLVGFFSETISPDVKLLLFEIRTSDLVVLV